MNIDKSNSYEIFDRIARQYDRINTFLSLGLSRHWHSCLVRQLPKKSSLRILDLATGTADTALAIVKYKPDVKVIGLDRSSEILKQAQIKIQQRNVKHILLTQADANQIPFADHEFDAATMSFGIRNVVDPQSVFNEILRILKPKGTALIMEFSMPPKKAGRIFFLFVLHYFVPLIGRLFNRDAQAYKYLAETIQAFPSGKEFISKMKAAGFESLNMDNLFFGFVTIYKGEKP